MAWEEGLCQDLVGMFPGFDCDLFNSLEPSVLDENWGIGCNIPVAYDVVCEPQGEGDGDGRIIEVEAEGGGDGAEEAGEGGGEGRVIEVEAAAEQP